MQRMEGTDPETLREMFLQKEHSASPQDGWDPTYVTLDQIKQAVGNDVETASSSTLHPHIVHGYMCEKGRRRPIDHQQALQHYMQAVRAGSVLAAFLFGRLCLLGDSSVRNVECGLRYLQFAAFQGNTDAIETLAWYYLRNPQNKTNYNHRKAVYWYTQAAEKGHPRAQYNLGYIYSHGLGLRKDHKLGMYWYRKAAGNDYPQAQYKLGMALLADQVKTASLVQAIAWLRLAADAKDPRAQYQLGLMYSLGKGVPQDDTIAVFWYRLAADQHYGRAAYNLGLSYKTGLGVPCDPMRAFRYLLYAAKLGYARAQYQLAKLYQSRAQATPNSTESNRSKTLAFSWAGKAARNGEQKAQSLLGEFYALGYSAKQDLVRAYGWLYLASLAGEQKARSSISRIASLLPEEDIEEAFDWAMHWHRGKSQQRSSQPSRIHIPQMDSVAHPRQPVQDTTHLETPRHLLGHPPAPGTDAEKPGTIPLPRQPRDSAGETHLTRVRRGAGVAKRARFEIE